MTTRGEMSKINKIIEVIEKNAPISKVHLVIKTGMSISYFDKIKPFVEEIYPHKVRWDKETKLWYVVSSTDMENES